jgi:excinuclease UvrABC nuclease subunit
MQAYLEQVARSVEFACAPIEQRKRLQAEMHNRSRTMDFEGAQALKAALDRTAMAERHEFARVADFNAFKYLALAPSERRGWVRVFVIDGGWIAPVLDADAAAQPDRWMREAADRLASARRGEADFSSEALENMAVACRHLLLPRSVEKRGRTVFIHVSQLVDKQALTKAIAGFAKVKGSAPAPADDNDASPLEETELERL